MIQAVSKTFFHALAGSSSLKRFASSYGLRSDTELRTPLHRG